jgi:plastocyanin
MGRARAIPSALLAPLLLLSAGSAGAGVIRGELSLARRGTPAAGGVTDAAIYVERVPDKVERKLAKNARKKQAAVPSIVQARQRFTPRVLLVTAGSPVAFENRDRVYHNTFSVARARRFDLGKYPPGHRDTVVFDRAGVANLHCDIHPDEIGFVVVAPNHVHARPDTLGRFALPKLPPGEYQLRVWHPRRGELTRAVTLPRRGDVRLALAY